MFRGKSQIVLVAVMLFVAATATFMFLDHMENTENKEGSVPSVGLRYSEEGTTTSQGGSVNGTTVEIELIFGGPIEYANLSVEVNGESAKTWNGTGYVAVDEGDGRWTVGETLRLSCHGNPCKGLREGDSLSITRKVDGAEIGVSSHTVG